MKKYALTVVVVVLAITSAYAWASSRGKGTGGIPAVLHEIDRLAAQMGANQTALLDRFDAVMTQMEANQMAQTTRFDTVDSDAEFNFDAVAPCTIERFMDLKCNPLDIKTTMCFDVTLKGGMGLGMKLAPYLKTEWGGGWADGPVVNVKQGINTPGVIFPFGVPIVLPDLSVALQGSTGVVTRICFSGVEGSFLDISGTASARAAADDFAHQWVQALQDEGPNILDALLEFAIAKELTPDKVALPVKLLQGLEATVSDLDDPLKILSEGKLREFIDVLPLPEDLADLLDDPGQLIPDIDFANPIPKLCENLRSLPLINDIFGDDLCGVIEGFPKLDVAIRGIESVLGAINAAIVRLRNDVCDALPFGC